MDSFEGVHRFIKFELDSLEKEATDSGDLE